MFESNPDIESGLFDADFVTLNMSERRKLVVWSTRWVGVIPTASPGLAMFVQIHRFWGQECLSCEAGGEIGG